MQAFIRKTATKQGAKGQIDMSKETTTHTDHTDEHKKHHDKDRDILAKEQPWVLESSASDPVLPAMQEFEVDEGGAPGSTSKHPGLLWAIIALAAVIALVVVLIVAGDWLTPSQAERASELQFEQQTFGEDLGATE